MGGRGSSSGMSVKGRKYGSQYHTVLTDGNIKFVEKNDRTSESLMETMTKGRVYVVVGGHDILQIIYFDSENRRKKTIDLTHRHKNENPHVHHGYEHNENDGPKGATSPDTFEKRMIEHVRRVWYNNKHQTIV